MMKKFQIKENIHSLFIKTRYHIDGLAQDFSNSIALAMELLQSCARPSTYNITMTRKRKALEL